MYGLDPTAIYSVTTDSGANVLKTSRKLLEDIQLLVDEEEAKFLEQEIDTSEDSDNDAPQTETMDLETEVAVETVAEDFCEEAT